MSVTTAKWSLEDYHQIVAIGLLKQHPVEFLRGEIVEIQPFAFPDITIPVEELLGQNP